MNDLTTPWHSLQIRYYQTDQDGLILDAVRPLLEELGERVRQPYFVRHWRRGPHLRLNLRAPDDAWREEILPLATDRLGRYLRDHPSRTVPDEAALEQAHRALAVRESDHGPLRPWYPDNTLQTEPYEDRLHVLGSRTLRDLLDSYHAESTRMAFGTLAAIRRGELPLFQLSLDLMIAFAHTSVPPISRGYMSFRSHADAFASYCVDRDGVRAGFEAKYREHERQLRALVRRRVAEVDEGRTPPHVREWLDYIQHRKAIAAPLIRDKKIDLDAAAPEPEMRQLHPIDFHEVLLATGRYKSEVLGSDWFLGHRLAINMLYGHLARLGLAPLQRYLFCHLIAAAVEAEYDVSPVEKAAAWARS
ncbi:thiopeptide maturation pyridine synthase [Nonomuraea sp. WAC 01424]|uniref:thiopeptide maturation pyridine synthase n=1 Tax=Nonomuraea sp. WAC 01424 TaxID=2203200 RepID=UPI00163C0F5C|nr:thiopeptide maturation pyridine synthase [Nonomuraea sp. WAC 01424]